MFLRGYVADLSVWVRGCGVRGQTGGGGGGVGVHSFVSRPQVLKQKCIILCLTNSFRNKGASLYLSPTVFETKCIILSLTHIF